MSRHFSRLASAVLLTVGVGACTLETTVRTAPVVTATADVDMPARATVILGASAVGSSPIAKFEWTVVSSPAMDKTEIVTVNAVGDVAELHTSSVAGTFVVSVTATDEDGLVSDPDFVNVRLRPKAQDIRIAVLCSSGCRTAGTGLAADESTTLTFDTDTLAGAPEGVRWSAKLVRDPSDASTGEVQTSESKGFFTVTLPSVSRDAQLTVTGAAYAPGVLEGEASLQIAVINAADDPPTITLEWHTAGHKPGTPAAILPGDVLYFTAKVADPNGDAATCSFPPVNSIPSMIHTLDDPCRLTVFPLAHGELEIVARATANGLTTDATVKIPVAPLRAGPAQDDLVGLVVSAAGYVVGSNGGKGAVYTGFDTLTPTTVAQQFDKSGPVSLFGDLDDTAVIGFGAAPGYAFIDITVFPPAVLPEWVWPAPAPATKTLAMSRGSKNRVWAGTDKGIALLDGTMTPRVFRHWAAGGAVPAITWSPNRLAPGSGEGFVWFAKGTQVLVQRNEGVAAWTAAEAVGTVNEPMITALSFGTTKLWDLWVGTGPTTAGATGAGLILYKDAVDATTGAPAMNAGEEFFAQESGGVGSVAVESGGAFEGDAWAVVGKMVKRVTRVALDEKTPEVRAVTALDLQVSVNGKARQVATTVGVAGKGRMVALTTDTGLVGMP